MKMSGTYFPDKVEAVRPHGRGTTTRMWDDSRDAYKEIGGRATQDAKAEGGGRERLEHVLEVE